MMSENDGDGEVEVRACIVCGLREDILEEAGCGRVKRVGGDPETDRGV